MLNLLVLDKVMPKRIRIAWVDHCQLTRECMTAALSGGGSPISAIPYESFTDLIAELAVAEFDLVVLHAHNFGEHLPQQIAAIRRSGFEKPIILLTADEEPEQMAAIRSSLRLGASGHLSTRSTGIEMAITSFAFAHEGGTFAPLNLLLADEVQARRLSSGHSSGPRGKRVPRSTPEGAVPRLARQPALDPNAPPGKDRRGPAARSHRSSAPKVKEGKS
jgi:DNA-binding NarL/FixJ family response regulator